MRKGRRERGEVLELVAYTFGLVVIGMAGLLVIFVLLRIAMSLAMGVE